MLDKPEMVFWGKFQMDVGYEDLPIFGGVAWGCRAFRWFAN
jgi:hypothetical protein